MDILTFSSCTVCMRTSVLLGRSLCLVSSLFDDIKRSGRLYHLDLSYVLLTCRIQSSNSDDVCSRPILSFVFHFYMVICINSYQHSNLLFIKARPKGVEATYNERTRKGRIKIDRLIDLIFRLKNSERKS